MIGTGIDADDDMSFYQAGAERLTLYNGNVGIGTTSPVVKLDVVGRTRITQNNAEFGLEVANTLASSIEPAGQFWTAGQGPTLNVDWAGTVSTDLATFKNYGNIVASIKTSGGAYFGNNVGIGTTSPARRLDVRDGSGAGGYGGAIQVGAQNVSGDAKLIYFGDGPYVTIGENVADDRMELTAASFVFNNGNVGIGTTSPSQKLDVAGTVVVSGSNTNEVNRAQTGAANIVPIAYGNIASAGTIYTGTGNFTSTWNATSSWYEITISGESYNFSTYITIATPTTNGYRATTSSVGGMLLVLVYNITGTQSQGGFQFVTFKP